jgi:class 3 adenylate cyclase/DNA-binding response OmpR family regulator
VAEAATVLIVDDEPVMHAILEGLLKSEGYEFAFAQHGLEALEKIESVNPDLILLDIMMPKLSGFEVCQRLKTDKKWQNVPIILISALDGREDLVRGLDAGANDFLRKPFDRIELMARVRSMLRLKAQYDELEDQRRQLEATLHLREELARSTAQHLEELQTLHEVGLRLMSNHDTDSVMSMTAQVALVLTFGATCCIMHLLSDDGQQVLPVVFAEDGSKMVYPSVGFEDMVQQVLATRAAVVLPDIPAGKVQSPLNDIRSLLVVPLLADQQPIGTLSLYSAQPNAFEESHHHILSILANQAAVAMVKTRFFEDQARIKEQEKQAIHNLFGRYVNPAVVDRLVHGVENLALGGKRQEISVLFADIRGFTSFGEYITPERLVEVLNEYFGLAVDAILSQEGTLDKFMGDAVMALFNAPLPQDDHPLRAVRTALAIQAAMFNYSARIAGLSFGIGLHLGQAVVGNIGTAQQMNYTAIGDTVNLTKRLQEYADGGQIILSQAMYEAVRDHVTVEDLGPLLVKGRTAAVHTYRLVGLSQV